MKKSDKKIETRIVKALKSVCDSLTLEHSGFCWLTHFVDYANFPHSLRIVCVFDTNLAQADAENQAAAPIIVALIETQFEKAGVLAPYIDKALFFDSEEQGADVSNSRWCRKYTL